MRKINVIKVLFLGLFFMTSMCSFGMKAEAKSWNDKPNVSVESMREMDEDCGDEIPCEMRNFGSDKDSNNKAKEWNIPTENFKNTIMNEEKKSVVFKLEEDTDIYVWIKDTFTEWIRVLEEEIRKSVQVSQEWIFDGLKCADGDELLNTLEKHKGPLKASTDTGGKKDVDNHLKEVRYFSFDAKKAEEKQSKKNNKKRRPRNKKNLENKNNVYVNSIIKNHVEVVCFALGKEKEWITRIETLF